MPLCPRRSLRLSALPSILLLGALLAASTAFADPVAVLASVKGRVDVTPARGGAAVRASFGRPLERGDRVVVGPDGAASVFFDDGNVIELEPRSALTIGGKVGRGPKVGPGAGLPGEVYAQVSRYATGGSRQTGLVAMSQLRGSAMPFTLLLEPRMTTVLDPRPAFAWAAVEGATRYQLKVTTEAGESWSREATATRLDYPADATPLPASGEVLWEVQAFSDAGPLRREESAFRVAADADAASMRANLARIDESAGPGSAAAHFLAGTYLYGRGFYADAARHLEALTRISPDAPAAHEALGNVYRAIGLMDRAAAEYERALALNREP